MPYVDNQLFDNNWVLLMWFHVCVRKLNLKQNGKQNHVGCTSYN